MNRYLHLPLLFATLSATLYLNGCAPGHGAQGPDKDDKDVARSDEVVQAIRPHCVRVFVYVRKHEGDRPNEGTGDLENERPLLWAGYLWDKTTVLVNDPVLHARFIRKIEVEAGGETVAATIQARFLDHQSMLLHLERPLPGFQPLRFASPPERKDVGKLRCAYYQWSEGDWTFGVTGAAQGFSRTEDGEAFLWGQAEGLLVDPKGNIVGATFSGRLGLDGNVYPWKGTDLRALPVLTTEEMNKRQAALKRRLQTAAPEVLFQFRAKVDEDDDNSGFDRFRSWGDDDNRLDANAHEFRATGFALSPTRLLVPAPMPREMVAKVESITVIQHTDNGKKEMEAEFVGALKTFHALVVELKSGNIENPLSFSESASFHHGRLFLKANVNHEVGKRKARLAYDRFRGFMRTYHDLPGVTTFTNEKDGSVAFTPDGQLLAISVAARPKPSGEDRYSYRSRIDSIFRPAALVATTLGEPEPFDPTIRPVAKEQEKRLVILGIEAQSLTVDLAKVFKVEKITRGGQIGLLVQHVYPGTSAETLGLKERDILLRMRLPERAEPIELTANLISSHGGYYMHHFGGWGGHGMGGQPWPEQKTGLNKLLTQVGEGKQVTVEYVRDGKVRSEAFTTRKSKPDFNAARKYKNKPLGLTVKEITYEVQHYFRRADASGVVVSKVEPGSKAAVAGVMPSQLITDINREPVKNLEDFKNKLRSAMQNGHADIELTVDVMGKTHFAKIRF